MRPKSTATSTACAFALLIVAPGLARADDDVARVKVSGYGTLAAVATDDGSRTFFGGANASRGATNKPDLDQDSRLGLQGVVNFQPNFSVTGQVVAKRRLSDTGSAGSDRDFSPAVDWLFAQYDFSTDLNVRLGRMAVPTFLLSDSLNVGYSANWLRAPSHLYHSFAFNDADGLELNYRHSFGDFNVSAQALHGTAKAPLYTQGSVNPLSTNNLNAFNVIVEHGNWLGRVGVARARGQFLPGVSTNIDDTYSTAGLQYDDGTLVLMGEFARRSENKLAAANNHPVLSADYAYVAAGWRVGKLLPIAMLSKGATHFNIPVGGSFVLSGHDSHLAPSIGLRYDAMSNVSLKAQVDRYDANDSNVLSANDADTRHKVNVYSAGVDFVF